MSTFSFDGYEFDQATYQATFRYSHTDPDLSFVERITFDAAADDYDKDVLVRALDLAHLLVGVSYNKCFANAEIAFASGGIDDWQAAFLNHVYQEGLSQYAFENGLTRRDLAQFVATTREVLPPIGYRGQGIVSMQSGGKDSLLVAALLEKTQQPYTPFYIRSSDEHPALLDTLSTPLVNAYRRIDRSALQQASELGGLNGHVPVTYIALAYALVQGVLLGKNTVLAAIAHEGEEPHAWIDDLPVNHQWSKTWPAERLFAEYVRRYISADIRVGSPLRQYSELRVAQLFAEQVWGRFGETFSSCNVANYQQQSDNTTLTWCGRCPKCANSYLLFAPFVPADVLQRCLGGALFAQPELADTFRGLLGVDGVMKPFECVGEVDELRRAYHLAQQNSYESLPFDVPDSTFAIDHYYQSQSWAADLLQ